MDVINQSPVTANAEQATTYSVAENENGGVIKPQASITPDSNCDAQSNPTAHVPLDKCLCGTYITGTRAGTIPANPNLKEWDGKPLKEGVVYHRNEMLGLPECTILENRDAQSRAKDWQKICRENGMTNPALYANAEIAKKAGLTPAIYLRSKKKWWIVPDPEHYCIRLDGNGRAAGHDLDLEEATKNPSYIPFDFQFIYKKYTDAELFIKQYISVNLDVKKTTKSELLSYSLCRNKGSNLNNYYTMMEEGFVAKSSSYYNFGRELTKEDVKKASKGQDITVEQELVDSMALLLKTYRKVFFGNASVKILKGVPLARWSCETLKKADDMKAMADKISDKFSKMLPEQLTKLQDAKGVKGDRTKTTEIILIGIFNEILNS